MFDAGGGGGKVEFVAETVSGGAAGSALVGSQTKFSVDPAQARKLIDGLTLALDKLIEIGRQADQIRTAESPGKDPYSGAATKAIRAAAGMDAGGYGWANKQACDALTKTIDNIEAALKQYESTENAAEQGLKG
ncbi:hypothetical protein GCM10022243_45740 [Saccharothrix violaceirubra]|uniref:Excreted virulence factor EspC (Type VII ESX diderm) n=1 Tax=Saccharothrix violaceirubra TaxID=413306 RepID=A0A7W7T0X3_9PSEU|nr:hypothetical protein [Saccharothrix violaceirubra]MBB4964536.1 hypothetical protein [Saccharothrix violaceirubra]